MKVQTFIAPTAKEAIETVHSTLGPDAIVVNIRKLPKPGWQGLFQSPQVEVSTLVSGITSTKPGGESEIERQVSKPISTDIDAPALKNPQVGSRLDIVDDTPIEIPKLSAHAESDNLFNDSLPKTFVEPLVQALGQMAPPGEQVAPGNGVNIGTVLEGIGVLPLQVERLLRLAKQRFPKLDSCPMGDQVQYIRHCLIDHWNSLAKVAEKNSHSRKVLVGAPGSGKTTVLCKWLTQTVLAKRQPARVWRLDGHQSNTAEMLTVHAEMLDVEVNRVWYPEPVTDGTVQFFDLPGVMPSDSLGLDTLKQLANEIQPAEFILVLNSAYELDHLIRSVRAFGDLPINGLIATHLDEETKWSKLWNLTLETGLPILYCSGGQEIPGDFVQLTSEMLFHSVMQQLEPENSTKQLDTVFN